MKIHDEQIRRASRLLQVSRKCADDPDIQFVLLLGALHLGRAAVEHVLSLADRIPPVLQRVGQNGVEPSQALRKRFEEILSQARRYSLIHDLRRWDFHWEPLQNPASVGPSSSIGRGSPMVLATGPGPGAVMLNRANMQIETRGSGKRVGRTNYYRMNAGGFVDFDCDPPVAVLFGQAIEEFLADLPPLIDRVFEIDEVKEFIARS